MKVKILLFFALIPAFTYATSCSYVKSIIKPISMNEKGEILCKTWFGMNKTGGSYSYDIVKYGFCVLSSDSIHYYKGITLVNNGEEIDFEENMAFWDAIFNAETAVDQLKTIVSEVLEGSFGFTELNAAKFKKDAIIDHEKFQNQYGIDLNENRQESLFKGFSNKNTFNGKVHLMYDFGGTLFIENDMGCREADGYGEKGCDFSYSYKDRNTYGFDIDIATGLIFKSDPTN
jgi:hypothetical protein